jgi:hypothetical protein
MDWIIKFKLEVQKSSRNLNVAYKQVQYLHYLKLSVRSLFKMNPLAVPHFK